MRYFSIKSVGIEGDCLPMGEKNFNSKGLEFENFEISIEKDREGENQDAAVLFSSKLVELLIAKMKEHNSFAPRRRVSLNDLKRVYTGRSTFRSTWCNTGRYFTFFS